MCSCMHEAARFSLGNHACAQGRKSVAHMKAAQWLQAAHRAKWESELLLGLEANKKAGAVALKIFVENLLEKARVSF